MLNQYNSELLKHNQILNELLRKIELVDFLSLAEVPKVEHITNRHYQVITIEEILRLAEANRWGLCRRHDFIYLYNGAYWDVLESDELKAFIGKASEAM